MKCKPSRKAQRGMSLIEVMIALTVLAIGLGGLIFLFANALLAANRNSRDSSATFLAKMVIEAISAQKPNSGTNILLTDCQNNTLAVTPVDATYPPGAGASLTSSGLIDWTQDSASVPAGYSVLYQDCGTGGGGAVVTYEVRWNVSTITATQTRMVTVSARPKYTQTNQMGGRIFAFPVTLRGIAAY